MNELGVLSDLHLNERGPLLISPFDASRVQPSSYDLALSNSFARPISGRTIDLRDDDPKDHMEFFDLDELIIKPGEAILGCTEEVIHCPNDLSARVEGKSSIGRLFVAVHVTAGVVDAGFKGQITLEIVNHGPWNVTLWKGMKIAQLSYFKMSSECLNPYGASTLKSHYNHQMGATPARGRRRYE